MECFISLLEFISSGLDLIYNLAEKVIAEQIQHENLSEDERQDPNDQQSEYEYEL